MKRTFHFLLLMFCINASASAQNYYNVSECRDHLPRLKPTDIVNFPKKDSNAFVTSCTLDTVSKTIYYYHCYGGMFCSMSISKSDMHAILAKKITPFDYYDLVISFDVNLIEKAKKNLEANGSNAKFTSFEKQNLQIDDSVKFPSTLSKLLELDEQLVNVEVLVTKFHSVQPKYIKRDRSYYNTLGEEYGKMEIWSLSDSVVTFYNHLDAQPVYKAMLDLKKSVLYFYNRSDSLIDKIEINKNKIALLINEKFDVFALYRMWLEWKRQSIAEAIEETKKEGRVAEKKQYALNVLSEQSKMLYALDYKIEYFTNADKQYVLQKLRRQFGAIFAPNDPQETGRMIYQISGDKEYELTDHRGNVMVRISDNKKGVPRKDDPTLVDHYEAIVLGATDYTPFGSAMQGRSVNSNKYPYGYNGKENDNETGDQNYGMRIYDPRVARFLSVDPIASKYPMLTPYQFASNSPIAGIDMDGLEYLTAIYNVSIKNGQNTVSANYVWNNAQTHNAHGPLGQGVNYQIKINNLDNKTATTNNYFVSRGGNNFISAITQYGNYMGSDQLTNFNAYTGKSIDNTSRYDIDGVDFVDQQAKMHDQGYDRLKSAGASGLFSDWGTTPYDEAAANSWSNFYSNNKEGSIDPFNGQVVNTQEREAAWRGKTLFNSVVANKKGAISDFMQLNYKNQAKSTLISRDGTGTAKKEIEYNYQLFLQKYMQKDDKGNWTRNENMWNKDENNNYTTPKTNEQLK